METKTDTAPYEGHYWAYVGGFAGAVLLFAVTAALAIGHKGMMGWEISVFHAINNLPDSLRMLGLIISVAPESLIIGAAAVVTAFFCGLYRLAWRIAAVIMGSYFIGMLAKHFIGRSRPGEVLSDLHLRAHDSGMGFPSGHVMMVTILSLLLIPYVPVKWRWMLALPIIAMAWSRLYLGLHAPLDILGGFALGLAAVCFIRILPQAVRVFFRLD
jgi:membrane-associated phospholipid phosphatase